MMHYYLLRQSPNMNTIITTAEAMEWDVIMILKSNSLRIAPGILYQNKLVGFVYIHEVEQYAFDMMDAVDIPHGERKDFVVVVPQEIFTPLSHTTITREKTANRKQKTGIFLHSVQTAGRHVGTSVGMELHRKMG